MMIRARTRIALCSILLACVITCPRLALAAAPSITGPVFATYLADVTAGTVEITMLELTGENFGTPTLSGPTSVQVAGVTYSSTAPEIKAWQDTRIIVQTSRTITSGSVTVTTANGSASKAIDQVYALDWYDMPTGPPDGPSAPLHIATDSRGRLWINSEYHVALKMVDPSQQNPVQVLVSPRPPACTSQSDPARCGPPFAVDGALCGGVCPLNVRRTNTSSGGEAIGVDRQGRVWFPESGPPQSRESTGVPNRSRLTMYDPSTNTWRAYALPGDNQGINGVTFDYVPNTNTIRRVWTMTTRHDNETYYERATNAFTTYDVNEPSKVLSFDPEAICNVPNGNLICSDGTFADYTTDVNALICPPNVSDDSYCVHEYPLPAMPGGALPRLMGHLQVDPDGSVWVMPYENGGSIGRLNPTTGAMTWYPLPPTLGYSARTLLGQAPWDVVMMPDGNPIFTVYNYPGIGRFDKAVLQQQACDTLDPETNQNPCIHLWVSPYVELGGDAVQNLDFDTAGNIWFGQVKGAQPGRFGGFAYLKADRSGVIELPPTSLYPGYGHEDGISGVAVNRVTGEIWGTTFRRKRVYRLRRG
jgi:streptogramin lyase